MQAQASNTKKHNTMGSKRPRIVSAVALLSLHCCCLTLTRSFVVAPAAGRILHTQHQMWWYGGSEATEVQSPVDDSSCELVPVRIERTSANSRRICGEIIVPTPVQDVWAILTDYNRLAIHVPNLVDSKIEKVMSGGEMGDGQYRCRLYQKGAQKIVGFEFGASVTMDMQEMARSMQNTSPSAVDERIIAFKCQDSFFFQEFDGEWKARERVNDDDNRVETVLSYVVDVRPKGPVPVMALEWRIREDVPTNLRAVKKASMELGYEGVMNSRQGNQRRKMSPSLNRNFLKVKWNSDETMEKYLRDA